MSNKHTPGPWQSGGCVVWQSNGDMICDLSVVFRNQDITEANARLIATAPDLLEALEDLLKHFSFPRPIQSDVGYYFMWPENVTKALDNAKTAIAKAKGVA